MSLGYKAWLRLKKNKMAMVSIWLLSILTLAAVFLPFVMPHEYDEIFWDFILSPPNLENNNWMGTDPNGRDLAVRILYGMRVSLSVGLLGTLVTAVIGITYGAISGFAGKKTDALMMRFVDFLYAIPFMFFVIIMMVVFGRQFLLVFIAIGMIEWLTMARIVRGQTLSISKMDYVEAAYAIGTPKHRIIIKHVVPNLLGTVFVYVTLKVPEIILIESFLSFLGLGVQEPLTSLGVLISEGVNSIESASWLLIFPSIFLTIILFTLNFIGDGLRDAIDPKDK